jgi:hypothetical protein
MNYLNDAVKKLVDDTNGLFFVNQNDRTFTNIFYIVPATGKHNRDYKEMIFKIKRIDDTLCIVNSRKSRLALTDAGLKSELIDLLIGKTKIDVIKDPVEEFQKLMEEFKQDPDSEFEYNILKAYKEHMEGMIKEMINSENI